MNKLSLAIGFAAMMVVLATTACVTKEVPVVETYHETEYKVERTEGVNALTPKVKWSANLYGNSMFVDTSAGSCMASSPVIDYYGYEIGTSQYTRSNVKVSYSFTGNVKLSPSTYLYVHDLTGIGQIVLPINLEFGKGSQYKTVGYDATKGRGELVYVSTPEEQKWLEWYHSIVGTGDIFLGAPPEKALHLLASFTPYTDISKSNICSIDTTYVPSSGGLTDLGVAVAGKVYRYNCSITFDSSKVKEFAIISRVVGCSNALCTGGTNAFCGAIEVSGVQLIWTNERQVPNQVEKQRTVMQTKKIPFWEAILVK